MNRIAKGDAQQALLSHLQGSEPMSEKYLKRLGSEDLVELAITCVELHLKIVRSLNPELQERVFKAFEDWATTSSVQVPELSVQSSPDSQLTT